MASKKQQHDGNLRALSYLSLLATTGEGFWLASLSQQQFFASTECLTMLGLPCNGQTIDQAGFVSALVTNQFNQAAISIPFAMQRLLQNAHPMDVTTAASIYQQLMATSVPVQFELRLRVEHGQYRWYAVRAMKVTDADGQVSEVIGSVRDIHHDRFVQQTHAALYAISEATHSDADFQKLLETIHSTIAELLPAKNLFVALHDPDTDMVTFPYYVDEFDPPPAPRILSDKGLSHRVIRTGKPVLMTPEMRAERIARGEQIVGAVCLDWLGVPLLNAGQVIGALVIQSYSGDVRYNQRDLELLQFVSHQVASTIVRKQNQVHIERLAHTDPLTGVANRSVLDDRLEHALEKAKRQHTSVAVLYLDLDGFKPVNDQFGHAVGDQLLIEIAMRMKASLRASDTLARIGGDEFVVVTEDSASTQDALKVGEKLLAAIGMPWQLEHHQISVSASIGVAISDAQWIEAQQLLKAADAALYRAKLAGKGCVRLADASRADKD